MTASGVALCLTASTSLSALSATVVWFLALLSFIALLQSGGIWEPLQYAEGINSSEDPLSKSIVNAHQSLSGRRRKQGRRQLNTPSLGGLHMREDKLAVLRVWVDVVSLSLVMLLPLRTSIWSSGLVSRTPNESESSTSSHLAAKTHDAILFLQIPAVSEGPCTVGDTNTNSSVESEGDPPPLVVTDTTTIRGDRLSHTRTAGRRAAVPVALGRLVPLSVALRRRERYLAVYQGMGFWKAIRETLRQATPTMLNMLYVTQGCSLACLVLHEWYRYARRADGAGNDSTAAQSFFEPSGVLLGLLLFGFFIPFCLGQLLLHVADPDPLLVRSSPFHKQIWGFFLAGCLWRPTWTTHSRMITKGCISSAVVLLLWLATEARPDEESSVIIGGTSTSSGTQHVHHGAVRLSCPPSVDVALLVFVVTALLLNTKAQPYRSFPDATFAEQSGLLLLLASCLVRQWTLAGRPGTSTESEAEANERTNVTVLAVLLLCYFGYNMMILWSLFGRFLLLSCGQRTLFTVSAAPLTFLSRVSLRVLQLVLRMLFLARGKDRAGTTLDEASSPGSSANSNYEQDNVSSLAPSEPSGTTATLTQGKKSMVRGGGTVDSAQEKNKSFDLTDDDLRQLNKTVFSVVFGRMQSSWDTFLRKDVLWLNSSSSSSHVHQQVYYRPDSGSRLDLSRLSKTRKHQAFDAISHATTALVFAAGPSALGRREDATFLPEAMPGLPHVYHAVLLRCFLEYTYALLQEKARAAGRELDRNKPNSSGGQTPAHPHSGSSTFSSSNTLPDIFRQEFDARTPLNGRDEAGVRAQTEEKLVTILRSARTTSSATRRAKATLPNNHTLDNAEPMRRILDDEDDMHEGGLLDSVLPIQDEHSGFRKLPGIPAAEFPDAVYALLKDDMKRMRLLAHIRRLASGGRGTTSVAGGRGRRRFISTEVADALSASPTSMVGGTDTEVEGGGNSSGDGGSSGDQEVGGRGNSEGAEWKREVRDDDAETHGRKRSRRPAQAAGDEIDSADERRIAEEDIVASGPTSRATSSVPSKSSNSSAGAGGSFSDGEVGATGSVTEQDEMRIIAGALRAIKQSEAAGTGAGLDEIELEDVTAPARPSGIRTTSTTRNPLVSSVFGIGPRGKGSKSPAAPVVKETKGVGPPKPSPSLLPLPGGKGENTSPNSRRQLQKTVTFHDTESEQSSSSSSGSDKASAANIRRMPELIRKRFLADSSAEEEEF
eukprot:CAMPEP_0178992514 /NCGR_PEP_ID=MMETSP0795-20121207/6159_1 /TAXON_ID=88552 /ORGANISM="Amoebophrya sp., Strain Ameob2" /LENGTH=1222 /DNA_ID=CAMNT_0020684409 /DNA_START=368 /DNA_END=4037 /DNA_ORIENTATION=+